jgi:excinuclease ABC subunit C
MLNIKAFLDSVTTHPGVYQMLGGNGEVLYVGKARNLKKRLKSYFTKREQDTKTFALVKHIKDIQVTVTHSEADALLLECNLIKKYQPHYNILFRDDKSYPYIVIVDDQPYPYIDFYRGAKKKHGKYFGPYPSAGSVRETIHLIQKLFGLRLRKDKYYPNRARPCLQYQIGLCSGSCAGLISVTDYAQDVSHASLFLQGKNEEVLDDLNQKMEDASKQLKFELAAKLRDQIRKLRTIRAEQHVSKNDGDVDVIGFADICIQLLVIRGGRILGSRAYFPSIPKNATPEEIISSFITQHYLDPTHSDFLPKEIVIDFVLPDRTLLMQVLTQSARRKVTISQNVRSDRKKWLEIATKSAKQSKASFLLNKTSMEDRFNALQQELNFSHPIERIECFDISHTMGEATLASCVVFNTEGPVKSDYRRFNIKDITPGDDMAAMRQVLLRRYERLQKEQRRLPDLVLIDGGLPQLSGAKKVFQELNLSSIQMIGIAKGVSRRPGLETLYFPDKTAIHLSSDSLGLHLIQQIRDEAHRFAITGHRQKRAKKRRTSFLEEIPGVGAKRRRELLRYFGGIQAINRASLLELTKVPGISQSLAQRIFAAIHHESE